MLIWEPFFLYYSFLFLLCIYIFFALNRQCIPTVFSILIRNRNNCSLQSVTVIKQMSTRVNARDVNLAEVRHIVKLLLI